MANVRILAVDDNTDALFVLETLLSQSGFAVTTATDGAMAVQRALDERPDLILLDVQMPGVNGFEVTQQLKAHPVLRYSPIILLTANDTLADVLTGLGQGADDYLTKPYEAAELLARIQAALRVRSLYRELQATSHANSELKKQLSVQKISPSIIGSSAEWAKIEELIARVKGVNVPVLITGESGTGKELVASAIHYQSPRAANPLVIQNCAALQDTVLESEMFGYCKGAFTGAVKDKEGLFEIADGGTFFLDELAEMSLPIQAKLLRVLQDGTFTPVGGTRPRQVDVRIIAATNRNLREQISQGLFREDLFYRLNVIQLALPALRERATDLPLLAEHLLNKITQRYGYPIKYFSDESLEVLTRYRWPGNIRELENEITRAVLLSDKRSTISPEDFSREVQRGMVETGDARESGTLREALSQLEQKLIQQALAKVAGNKSEAARVLGVSRSNLIAKVQEYNLDKS